MNSGKLNRRVSLQKLGPAQDSAGQPIQQWTQFARAWANIKFVNGKEFATGGSEASSATVSVRLRYRTDLTAKMRVVYKDDVYSIVAVLPDEEDRDHIDLACTTGANDG
jgi:SPP1 family predicted phage head-tail adaptor